MNTQKQLLESILSKSQLLGAEFIERLRSEDMEFASDYTAQVFTESVEFTLSDGNGGKIFGADISIYNREEDYGNPDTRKVQMNYGSMGSFDLSCVASTSKTLLAAELIKNFELFSEIVLEFNNKEKSLQDTYRLFNK